MATINTKLIHVEMFEHRHKTPSYVDKFFYTNYSSSMDLKYFRAQAFEKASRWKAEGVTGIILYRSGLLLAYDEIVNVCWELNMYLCPMVFSYIQGKWLPSYLRMFDNFGVPNSYSAKERAAWDEELAFQARFSTYDLYKTYVRYAKVYAQIILDMELDPSLQPGQLLYIYKDRYNLKNQACLHWIKECITNNGQFYPVFAEKLIANDFKPANSAKRIQTRSKHSWR